MTAGIWTSCFPNLYLVTQPASFVGVLGAFISGSCTVSDTLFAALQYETAGLLGLPQVLVLAMQNCGGVIGNMICVNNIVAVCATTGTIGSEGRLIKSHVLPCVLYAAVIILVLVPLICAGFRAV